MDTTSGGIKNKPVPLEGELALLKFMLSETGMKRLR
jgi:hypothetical protein